MQFECVGLIETLSPLSSMCHPILPNFEKTLDQMVSLQRIITINFWFKIFFFFFYVDEKAYDKYD